MILSSPALSALPGLRHGFSTRLGGVSGAEHASFNLGRSVGDRPEHVAENLRRFELYLGLETPVFETSQVHGRALALVDAGTPREPLRAVEADALYARQPGLAVGVRTADCAPLLFAARGPDGAVGAVAAVHAGWRGATSGIVAATVERFRADGFAPERLTVALGPTIGPEAFEVGEEVIEAARASLDGLAPPAHPGPRGRPHLHLPRLLFMQLERLGVPVASTEWVGGCTAQNRAMFYSHRRDQGRTGRHLSAIVFGLGR